MRRTVFILITLLVFATLTYATQLRIDDSRGSGVKVEKFTYLPKGDYLRPVVIGFDQIVADIYWLRAIQVTGEPIISSMESEWIYNCLDLVTTLDPRFDYAYQVGGIVLSTISNNIEKSNALLEKGLRENPMIWQIPFYLGFNYFYHLNDYKTAAYYMTKASELPGHPQYLPKLTARLYVEAGEPDVGLEFLARMYNQTDDEKVRGALERRIKEVMVERDARILEEAITKFKEIYGSYPGNLNELMDKEILSGIPQEPFGGYYYFDTETGKVYSSVIKERMRIYRK